MAKRVFSAGNLPDTTPRRWSVMVEPKNTPRLVELLNQHGYKHKIRYPGGGHDMHTVTDTNALQMRPLFDSYDFIIECEWLDFPTSLA